MKLQFTNGYRPRFDQISRIMQYLFAQDGRKKIGRQEIVAALGIPDKQVENLISMMTGFGLIHPRISTLTILGKTITQSDPYFEKIETLWLIHYIVSSNPEWVVWYRIINQVIPLLDKISVDNVSTTYFSDLATQFSAKTISEKLPKEVGAVLAGYTRSDLARLNILQEERTGHFLRGNPADIPALVFLFCLINYRDRFSPGSSAINVEDVCKSMNSPGQVFNIAEYHVRQLLDELHNNGMLRLEKFGNLDQVRLSDTITQQTTLAEIYRG